ncbi:MULTISPECIES: M1 family metallopeptidase [unclassified Nocardia]|uniref:M1 family metallopeptidase n=1 Tax=unclassified Nocardia TaxID=2637762 RepID=UPI001CE3E518|nr:MULTISPECIES: M1 family metallopeptidase [unclassified Nocardia]
MRIHRPSNGRIRTCAVPGSRALLAPAVVALSLICGATAAAAPAGAPHTGTGNGSTGSADPAPGSDGVGDPYYPQDGNGGYTAVHYDLGIDYDPPTHHLTGKATITANATQDLSAFNLDFAGPPVQGVTVNGKAARFDRQGEHELVITPADPLPNEQSFTVTVDYSGTAADTGGNGWTYSPSGGAFAAGEPHSATTWYPLNDTPQNKATVTLHATVPTGWDVASNGIMTSDNPSGTDHHTVTWEDRSPIIGYLTTIAIDKFTHLSQKRSDGTPLESVFAPGAAAQKQELEKKLPQVLDFEEQLYGPYPFEAGGGIYVDTDLRFSLETQTRPIYAPWTDLNTLIHENAHQWWGDSMSVTLWKDVCLNECFASYTADILWPERIDNQDADQLYLDDLARWEKRDIWKIPLFDPGKGNEFTTVYTRGTLFLHALRRTIGDDVFFTAVKDFVQDHKFGNASIPEFRDFMQLRSPEQLGGFFDAWLNGTTRPADEYLFPGSLADRHKKNPSPQINETPQWPSGQGDRKGAGQ